MSDPMQYLQTKKSELKRLYGINKIGIFGSRLRKDNSPVSDLDVLVAFDKPYRIDLLKFIELEQTLSDELGIKVDLVIEEDLKPHIGKSIRREVRYV
jgi:predicted nucleotidyltransferase